VLWRRARQRFCERRFRLRQRHAVLRPLRARHRRHHPPEIELKLLGEHRVGCRIRAEQALLLRVRLHQPNVLFVAPGETQIRQRFRIYRKKAHRRAVFRRHVGERRAVRQSQIRKPGAVEFHEFSDHAFLAQDLRDRQHQVRCRRAFVQTAVQLEAQHRRNQHREWLPQHGRLGFDSAHAPAKHAQAVDHRRVRVRAHQRVGKCESRSVLLRVENHAREILQVHLVANACIRRHHLEVLKTLLTPAEKSVALHVPLEFHQRVERQRVTRAEAIHLHRVIDYQLGRQQRIDFFRIASELPHRLAHRRKIHHRRHAGEVLQQHARRHERDFLRRNRFRVPLRQRAHILGVNEAAVLVAQQILEKHFQREGKARDFADSGAVKRVQPENLERVAANGQLAP
jgi:hypothetical protein